MPRFATAEQIAYVASQSAGIAAYHQKFTNLLVAFAGLIEAFSPASGIEIREISPQGRDEEQWRGMLVSATGATGAVDLWCLSITGTNMLSDEELPAGAFDKPFTLAIDYFYDYDFGDDTTNSDAVFTLKVDTIEYLIERLRTDPDADCLPVCCIESGAFIRGIKTFENASTHFAKGDMLLSFEPN